jgi:photosystem II stability/assembly factor-like uncharacterized protein
MTNNLLKKGLLGSALVATVAVSFYVKDNVRSYEPRKDSHQIIESKRKFAEAADYYFMLRRNQITNTVPEEAMLKARLEVMEATNNRAANLGLQWTEMGPDNVGGRTRAVMIDYVHDPSGNTIFAGGVDGGLWKSTNSGGSWSLISDQWDNIAVVSIAQTPNGRIYVGTGEYLLAVRGTPGTGNSSCIGGGVWVSDDGVNFSHLQSTAPTTQFNNAFNGEWSYVYSLNASFNPAKNRIFAGTRRGLRASDDNGQTWYNPVKNTNGTAVTSACNDIEISTTGDTVIASIGFNCWVSYQGGNDGTWVNRSGSSTGLPGGGLSNLQLAISPSNPNYVYAVAAASQNFSLQGVYQSTNGGQNWTQIAAGSPTFQPLANQGDYNCCVAVYPTDPERIIIGGLDLYRWKNTTGWEQASAWFYSQFNQYYVHADNHTIVFDRNNPNRVFVGNDGGVFRSTNGGQTWAAMNRGYNTVQFYGLGYSKFRNRYRWFAGQRNSIHRL